MVEKMKAHQKLEILIYPGNLFALRLVGPSQLLYI